MSLGSFLIKDVTFDRTSVAPPIGAYILASDGTNSAIWHTADAFATPVVWTEGATFSGVFTQIRSAGTAGGVLVKAPNDSLTSGTVNITYGRGSGPASATVGTPFTVTQAVGGPPGSYQFIITLDQCCTVQWVSGSVHNDGAGGSYSDFSWGGGGLGGCGTQYYLANQPTSPSTVNAHIGETWNASKMSSTDIDSSASGPFVLKITSILSGGASVRYSSDYGATVGSAVSVGTATAATDAGFDLERTGGASIAAAAGQVKIATSLGGSYSNAAGGTLSSGDPATLVIPYRRWDHGATQYSASDPDYLLVGTAAISGASVWKVNGTSGTKTDITPSGAVGIGPNLATVWQSSSVCKLAIVVNVSGTDKLYTSLNGGTSWTFRRNVTSPIFLRCRRADPNGVQLYLIDGSTLYVSSNWGVSWLTDTTPSSDAGIGMDIFG